MSPPARRKIAGGAGRVSQPGRIVPCERAGAGRPGRGLRGRRSRISPAAPAGRIRSARSRCPRNTEQKRFAVFGNFGVQRVPAFPPFLQVHGQAEMHRLGDLVGIVRIDDQRVASTPRPRRRSATGSARRIVGVLRGDIFLGHQIHAVAQRRDQARRRRRIEAGQRVAARSCG